MLGEIYNKKGEYSDGWVDVSKFKSPVSYIKNVINLMNYMTNDNKLILNKDCLVKFKVLLINTFPYVARESTMDEQKDIEEFLKHGFEDFI